MYTLVYRMGLGDGGPFILLGSKDHVFNTALFLYRTAPEWVRVEDELGHEIANTRNLIEVASHHGYAYGG